MFTDTTLPLLYDVSFLSLSLHCIPVRHFGVFVCPPHPLSIGEVVNSQPGLWYQYQPCGCLSSAWSQGTLTSSQHPQAVRPGKESDHEDPWGHRPYRDVG